MYQARQVFFSPYFPLRKRVKYWCVECESMQRCSQFVNETTIFYRTTFNCTSGWIADNHNECLTCLLLCSIIGCDPTTAVAKLNFLSIVGFHNIYSRKPCHYIFFCVWMRLCVCVDVSCNLNTKHSWTNNRLSFQCILI